MSKQQSQTTEMSKSERFIRIAEKRTVKVLDALRLLGQCSNKRMYEYDPSQVDKIFREIRRTLRETEQRFKSDKIKADFKL